VSRAAAFITILLAAAVCFAVALARALSVPLSSDIAWQLHIAELLARGAQLGRDVIEVNPPLSAWLEVPVVRLAGWAGIGAPLGHELAVFLLGMISVGLVALAGEHVAVLQPRVRLLGFALTAALALALQAGLEVGQREQLAIMLALPHFVLLAARLEGTEVPPWLAGTIGIAAGVGFAFKPFFLLPLLLGELVLVRRRELRAVLRRPELAAIVAVFAVYALAVALAAPGWLSTARTFWPLYGTYRPATLYDLLTRQGIVIVIALLALLAWEFSRSAVAGRSQLGNALATALAGFLVAMLLQRKPWIYLAIPSGVLSLLLLVTTVLETSGRVRSRAAQLARAVLVLGASLRVGRYVWWLLHVPVLSVVDRTSLSDYTGLRAALEGLPRGTTMAALSPTHGVTFPLVQDIGATWTMRLPSLWPAISGAAQDSATQESLRRIVIEDFQRYRPELVLVLVPKTSYRWLGSAALRDWRAWLAASPDGAAVLAPYRPWRRVGEFTVWRRERPAT